MSNYDSIKFLHVIRIDEVADILTTTGKKYVFPKLDGTNGTVWYDGRLHCGSRNRELSADNDNVGFYGHVMNSDIMKPIRDYCHDHPGMVVCGEWLSSKAGSIKQYVDRQFWIFDIHGVDGGYVSYEDYSETMYDYGYQYVVSPLAIFYDDEVVSIEALSKIADANHFNLPSDVIGEGVVVKNYDYRDNWGHYQEGKLVRTEYIENKGKKKLRGIIDDVEQTIADDLVTTSDVIKCMNKVAVTFGSEFDKSDNKMVGMVMTMVYADLLSEEILVINKKYGKYPITLNKLKNCVTKRVRDIIFG